MAEVETSIDELRDRLTGLLADWGAEFSMLLKELETKRARLRELEDGAAGRDDELEALNRKLEGQEELVQTLREDAEAASDLRRQIHAKDLELERLTAEVESKKELVSALRTDAETAERLREESSAKDRDMDQLLAEKESLEQMVTDLNDELASTHSETDTRKSQEAMELESVRAELDARKTLIESLRADADRLGAVEAALDEKRKVIAKLEDSMDSQAATIGELKESVTEWQNKYAQLKTKRPSTGSTTTGVPALSDTDLRAIEDVGNADGTDKTIAIDMRESLLEARRTSSTNK